MTPSRSELLPGGGTGDLREDRRGTGSREARRLQIRLVLATVPQNLSPRKAGATGTCRTAQGTPPSVQEKSLGLRFPGNADAGAQGTDVEQETRAMWGWGCELAPARLAGAAQGHRWLPATSSA